MLIIIDYQPVQIDSMDRKHLVDNIVRVAKIVLTYELPIVLSTINVTNGINKPTIHQLLEVLTGVEPLDHTTINVCEDEEFAKAVKATGRKKLIMTALWTEGCLTFPSLDAMSEGFEVYPVVDVVAGTSVEAHRAGLKGIIQAGGKPTS
jgi:nicotinamidase-related amidase